MDRLSTRNLSAGTKILMLIAFSILTGFMWRVRGAGGFGSMWGMFAVGVAIMLFIFAFFGNRKKMSYEAIPAAVILLGITNGGWGTLNSQMGGYLGSTVAFNGNEVQSVVEISPYSGLAIMLLLGFGWMPLFALFLGSLFSKREYKIRNYIMLIAVYYVVFYAMQFTLSHYILPLINPQAVEGFKQGLADFGVEGSPLKVYFENMGSDAWGKKIPFGRNYFTSIKVISSAVAALISSVSALVILRDKITAFISTGINLVCAIAITVADIFLILDSDRGFFASVNCPRFIEVTAWSLWEFFTGFLLGFGIMLILICLPESISAGEGKFEYEPAIENNKIRAAYNAVLTFVFTFVLTLARPLGGRIGESFVMRGIKIDDETLEIIFAVAFSAVALIPACIIAKKNCVSRGMAVPVAMRTEDFCMKAMPVYFLGISLVYFVVGLDVRTDIVNLAKLIRTPSTLLEALRVGGGVVTSLMLIAFVLFWIFWALASKSAKKNKN